MEPTIELFDTKLEQFHTFFGQLEGSESITVVNILADNAFKHQITLSDNTVSHIIVPAFYTFNLLTDLQYNDTEFKGLFINLGALTHLIRGISQLKVLEQLNILVQLDKT